ncbi:MAG: hypothetical protein V4760_10015 [Bdellovibrionota bacterium]
MRVNSYFAFSIFVFSSVVTASFARAENLPLEFKIVLDRTVPVQTTIQKLKYNRVLADHSYIYFFDTRDLRLYSAGLYIRARNVAGAGGELMVKARPLEPGDLDASWFDVFGLACDIDATPLKAVPACSVRLPTAVGAIDSVIAGSQPLTHILKPDQEFFANDFGGFDSVSKRVRAWGPVESWRWRVPNEAGLRVMADYWELPNGDAYVELSIRGLSTDHANLEAAVRAVMKEKSVENASLKLNKTSAVLKSLTGSK